MVDAGEGMTTIVPVFDGYSLPHLTKRFPISGHYITQYLGKFVFQRGIAPSSATKEALRDL